MRRASFRFISALLSILGLARLVCADPAIPGNILNPKSAVEAWNVIRLATENVDRLLEEDRVAEVPVQISYCSPALRALPGVVPDSEAIGKVQAEIARAFVSVNAIAGAAQQNNPQGVRSALASMRQHLDAIAGYFDATVVRADVFVCPMHPDFLSENPKTPCAKCGMPLLARRIPYSFLYTKPGAPTVRMSASASAPLEAGRKVDVTIRLEKADGSPVLPGDLLPMHTRPIHLLIEEPALGDYHREHPAPTQTPGEYAFSFTPAKTAPYRMWADIVPAATGVEEMPRVDLPSPGKGGAIETTANRFTATAGGYRFDLAFTTGEPDSVKAGRARSMTITVADAAGKPVAALEPVMNAFAHLVGFYDDFETVVHLHPTGGDVLDAGQRGGPVLGFVFFPPRPGFVRLYCQVSIGGQMLFAPFSVNVAP